MQWLQVHLNPKGEGACYGLLTFYCAQLRQHRPHRMAAYRAMLFLSARPLIRRLHGAAMGTSAMSGAGAGAGPKSESKGPAQRRRDLIRGAHVIGRGAGNALLCTAASEVLMHGQAPFWRMVLYCSTELRARSWQVSAYAGGTRPSSACAQLPARQHKQNTGCHGCRHSAVDKQMHPNHIEAMMTCADKRASICSLPGPRDGGLGRESKKAWICGKLGSSKDGRESLLLDAVLACCTGCCWAW